MWQRRLSPHSRHEVERGNTGRELGKINPQLSTSFNKAPPSNFHHLLIMSSYYESTKDSSID
jgi:hypothetical protein